MSVAKTASSPAEKPSVGKSTQQMNIAVMKDQQQKILQTSKLGFKTAGEGDAGRNVVSDDESDEDEEDLDSEDSEADDDDDVDDSEEDDDDSIDDDDDNDKDDDDDDDSYDDEDDDE